MILGILPTVANDLTVYANFIKLMNEQVVAVDLLVIGFQGDDSKFAYLRDNIANFHCLTKIEFTYVNEKSLARTKNILLKKYLHDFDYIFIYEDDVVYEKDYNEKMIKELNDHHADMISAVVKQGITIKDLLYALLYTLSHIYPFNDKRSLLGILPFGITIKTKYLSGGFSLAKKKVFEDFQYDNKLLLYSLGEDIDFSFRVSSRYKTIVTNKIRCVHNSSSIRKFNSIMAINAKINLWSYFFNKNINTKLHLPQYYLLLLVNLFEAFFISLKQKDLSMLKTLFTTIKLNRKGIYTSPFIEGSTLYDQV